MTTSRESGAAARLASESELPDVPRSAHCAAYSRSLLAVSKSPHARARSAVRKHSATVCSRARWSSQRARDVLSLLSSSSA